MKNDPQYETIGFTVDRDYMDEKFLFQKPVVEFEKVESIWSPDEYEMMICIGYTDMNLKRQLKFEEAKKKGYHIAGYRHPSSIVLTDDIGEGTFIMEGAIIGQSCKIGKGNVIWAMVHIAHHTTMGDYNFMTISCSVVGNVMIGNNCTIKNGIKIANYTLIGAGAYIRHNTEEKEVYVPPESYKLKGKQSLDFRL